MCCITFFPIANAMSVSRYGNFSRNTPPFSIYPASCPSTSILNFLAEKATLFSLLIETDLLERPSSIVLSPIISTQIARRAINRNYKNIILCISNFLICLFPPLNRIFWYLNNGPIFCYIFIYSKSYLLYPII